MNKTKKYLKKLKTKDFYQKDKSEIFNFFKSFKNLKLDNKKLKIFNNNFQNLSFFSYNTKLSIRKQTFFAKRLSFLIKSGVTIVESISLIKDQTKIKSELRVFERIITDVKNGKTLALSLERCCGTFNNFSINLIKAGEISGNLTQNLSYLAEELKKKEILRKKIIGALVYPIIVTIATFGITGFLTMYIFPKILPIFQSLNAKLPLSTRMIIFIVNTIQNYGLYILLSLIFIIIGIIFLVKKVYKIRFSYDGFLMRIPIFGQIAKNYNLTNICRTMGLLLKSGISVTEALRITADTTNNLQYKNAFKKISVGVTKGKTVSENIILFPNLFPSMLAHLVAVGEKTGNLSNTLIYLSEYYENEFEDQTKNLSSTIEPVLMIIMGIMVGFVAISVITPIYEITTNINR
jgi:type IV pilus assembly protein PilC